MSDLFLRGGNWCSSSGMQKYLHPSSRHQVPCQSRGFAFGTCLFISPDLAGNQPISEPPTGSPFSHLMTPHDPSCNLRSRSNNYRRSSSIRPSTNQARLIWTLITKGKPTIASTRHAKHSMHAHWFLKPGPAAPGHIYSGRLRPERAITGYFFSLRDPSRHTLQH